MRSASYEASMTTLSLVRGQATTYTLLSMGPRVSLVTCIKHSLHACVSTQPSASGSHFEPPRRKRSGILPLVVPPAATTKRATRKRGPWPGVFSQLSGPVGIIATRRALWGLTWHFHPQVTASPTFPGNLLLVVERRALT